MSESMRTPRTAFYFAWNQAWLIRKLIWHLYWKGGGNITHAIHEKLCNYFKWRTGATMVNQWTWTKIQHFCSNLVIAQSSRVKTSWTDCDINGQGNIHIDWSRQNSLTDLINARTYSEQSHPYWLVLWNRGTSSCPWTALCWNLLPEPDRVQHSVFVKQNET